MALYLLNSPQFIISYLAILKLGAVVTPISPVYTSQEVRHQLADSGARVVICQDILYDNVIKTEMEMEAIIVTGIADYLPPLKKRWAEVCSARWPAISRFPISRLHMVRGSTGSKIWSAEREHRRR